MKSIQEIIEGLLKRDKRAEMLFAQLLEKHCFSKVRSAILSRGGSEDDARFCFTLGCTVLWEYILSGKFKLDPKSPKPYADQLCAFVMTVAIREFYRQIKFKQGEISKDLEDAHFQIAHEDVPAPLEPLYRLAWLTVYDMGEPCQSRLADRYGRGLSYPEVGRREVPSTDAKTARRRIGVCVENLLSWLNEKLRKSEQQTVLEDIAMAAFNSMKEPCKTFLGKFYHPTEKHSMNDLAEEHGYKNEHVARMARHECMRELQFSIADNLLNNNPNK
ncbi:MAG: hypothetical protein KDD27_09270 [Saprospiraceae bacterium]|nr:hypothetical protein [Saprospiraceae bacterium]